MNKNKSIALVHQEENMANQNRRSASDKLKSKNHQIRPKIYLTIECNEKPMKHYNIKKRN